MTRLLRLRLVWVPAAALAIALLAVGAAAHFAHHLADPHCDEGGPASHPCVACSVLHGGVLAAAAQAPFDSEPTWTGEPTCQVTAPPLVRATTSSAPRAPPFA